MTTIILDDALVEALKSHNIKDIDGFVSRAAWKQLEDEDEDAEETLKICKEKLASLNEEKFLGLRSHSERTEVQTLVKDTTP
jgi:hypothetical protein